MSQFWWSIPGRPRVTSLAYQAKSHHAQIRSGGMLPVGVLVFERRFEYQNRSLDPPRQRINEVCLGC